MNFTPYPTKVQIKLLEPDNLLRDGNDRKQVGEVVVTGSECKFLKKGDIVFFGEWGFNETTEYQGERFCVVEEDSNFIQGKISKNVSRIATKDKKKVD